MPFEGDRRLHSAMMRGERGRGRCSVAAKASPSGPRCRPRVNEASGRAWARTSTARRVAATMVSSRSGGAHAVATSAAAIGQTDERRRAWPPPARCRWRPRPSRARAAGCRAAPAMKSDAPAFSSTMSRGAPARPASTSRAMRALSSAFAAAQLVRRRLAQPHVRRVQIERVDRVPSRHSDTLV